jgi:Holliday junction resolvase
MARSWKLHKEIYLFCKPKPWKRAQVYAYKVGWVTVKSELGSEFAYIKDELLTYKQKDPIPAHIPVRIELNVVYQCPTSRLFEDAPTQQLYGDVDNLSKAILDLLQDGHVRILSNDAQVTSLSIEKEFGDENHYQIRIYTEEQA